MSDTTPTPATPDPASTPAAAPVAPVTPTPAPVKQADVVPPLTTSTAPAPVVPVVPTQVRRPWRATLRTVFASIVGLASLAPEIYVGATLHDPATATGLAAQVLAVSGAVTRVLALPSVERFLARFAPFLAADPTAKP